MKTLGAALLTLVLSSTASAIPEVDYARNFVSKVLPFAAAHLERGSFRGQDQLTIQYAVFKNPSSRDAIVVSPGRTESYLKYLELAYDLVRRGYSIYIIDHRGQGLSGRMLTDPQIGYVNNFVDYVRDFEVFVDHIVVPRRHRKLYLLAHSMGSPIAMTYVAEHPGVFSAAAFSSPMLRLDTRPYPETVAFDIVYWMTSVGRGEEYALGQKPYDPSEPFARNEVTHSFARWEVARDMVSNHPEIALGGVSSRWVFESMKAIVAVRALAPKIEIPIVIFEAGEDTVVKAFEEERFCKRASRCLSIRFKGARHEILQETDEVRTPAIDAIVKLLRKP